MMNRATMEKKQKCKKTPYYPNYSQFQLIRIIESLLYFFNQYIIVFRTWQCMEEPPVHSWRRQTYAPTEFFVANLMLNNVYLKHFLIQDVLFAVLSPKVNLLSCFTKVKYCSALACCDVALTAP